MPRYAGLQGEFVFEAALAWPGFPIVPNRRAGELYLTQLHPLDARFRRRPDPFRRTKIRADKQKDTPIPCLAHTIAAHLPIPEAQPNRLPHQAATR
jgi:hypothetical protein